MTEVFLTLARDWGAAFIVGYFGFQVIAKILEYKKNGNGKGSKIANEDVVAQLKLLNTNHLTDIQTVMREGNADIVRAITDGNTKMIEILGRIDGKIK